MPVSQDGRKVLVLGPLPPPIHGASLVTSAVADELLRRGAQLQVVTTASDRSGLAYHADRVLAHLRALALLISWRAFSDKRLYLSVAGGYGLAYQAVLIGLAVRLGFVVVLHHHSFAYINTPSHLARVIARSSLGDGCHVFLCDRMRNRFASTYELRARAIVVNNAAFVRPPLERRRQKATNRFILGHLSNLSVDKGSVSAIQVFHRLVAEGADVELHLAGPIQDAATLRAVNAAKGSHAERFRYYGPLSRDKVEGFLQNLDVFLFPSAYKNEAQPLVVLEALAQGVPTVTTDVGCLPEFPQGMCVTVPLESDVVAGFTACVRGLLTSNRLTRLPVMIPEEQKSTGRSASALWDEILGQHE